MHHIYFLARANWGFCGASDRQSINHLKFKLLSNLVLLRLLRVRDGLRLPNPDLQGTAALPDRELVSCRVPSRNKKPSYC